MWQISVAKSVERCLYQQSLTRHDKVCCSKNCQKMYICCHVPCGKRYADRRGLVVHMKTAHERKIYTCHCGKAYSYMSGLSLHKKACKIATKKKTAESITESQLDRIYEEASAIPETQQDKEGIWNRRILLVWRKPLNSQRQLCEVMNRAMTMKHFRSF